MASPPGRKRGHIPATAFRVPRSFARKRLALQSVARSRRPRCGDLRTLRSAYRQTCAPRSARHLRVFARFLPWPAVLSANGEKASRQRNGGAKNLSRVTTLEPGSSEPVTDEAIQLGPSKKEMSPGSGRVRAEPSRSAHPLFLRGNLTQIKYAETCVCSTLRPAEREPPAAAGLLGQVTGTRGTTEPSSRDPNSPAAAGGGVIKKLPTSRLPACRQPQPGTGIPTSSPKARAVFVDAFNFKFKIFEVSNFK